MRNIEIWSRLINREELQQIFRKMCDTWDEYIQSENIQSLSMEEVRRFSGKDVAILAEKFQWNKQEMEKIVDEMFADGTTLSRVAHLLLFTELLIARYPLEKMNIYETTFTSLNRNLRL